MSENLEPSLNPLVTREDIVESLHALYIRIEEQPHRKGEITLAWMKSLPKEHRDFGYLIYGIAKERGVTDQTINISGQVGNLNLGEQYGAVTSTITVLINDGGPKKEVAQALQALAEGVHQSSTIGDVQKADVLEGLNLLGEQAREATPKRFTVSAVLKSLPDALKTSTELTKLWNDHGHTITTYFHQLFS